MRENDLIFQTISKVILFILLFFSFFIFLSGHNAPGGGFIGGLMTAAALCLLFLASDIQTMLQTLPIPYHALIGLGLALSVTTGLVAVLYDRAFLSHELLHFHLPLFGEMEWTTSLFFDLGVYFTVVGVTMGILLSMEKDR